MPCELVASVDRGRLGADRIDMTSHKHLKKRVRERMARPASATPRPAVTSSPLGPTRHPRPRLPARRRPPRRRGGRQLLATPRAPMAAASARRWSSASAVAWGPATSCGSSSSAASRSSRWVRNQWQYPGRWLARRRADRRRGRPPGDRRRVQAMADARNRPRPGGPPPLVWIDACEIGYWHLPHVLVGDGAATPSWCTASR